MKIAVLGASGMLGSIVLDYLSTDSSFQLLATIRNSKLMPKFQRIMPSIQWRLLDVERCDAEKIADVIGNAQWVINAIGVIKPYIHDDNAAEVKRAVAVNTLFPYLLSDASKQTGCRILQIATDCVFSGNRGGYTEKDSHDSIDVYGKTKSLGEVYSTHVHHIRCSIIGPEPQSHISLMNWFLNQQHGGSVPGYTNHQWNGITTLHFAKICHGIMKKDIKLPHVQHLIPANVISKVALLRSFAHEYHREDVTINPVEAGEIVDRTLTTLNSSLNKQLWEAAGYNELPSVQQMVAELARFNYRFSLENTK
jgi:dTDP-4-dehydrorhamnose reductase